MATPYDVIIIGTGAGGGTLARHLAPSGKRILLLERGDWLPRELENWDGEAVFVQNRYISPDTWYDKEAKAFQPQVHYCVGGATKLYGAALYRQRKEDFGELRHHDGISPAWPSSCTRYTVRGAKTRPNRHTVRPIPSPRFHTNRVSNNSLTTWKRPGITLSTLQTGLCSTNKIGRSAPAFAALLAVASPAWYMPNRMRR